MKWADGTGSVKEPSRDSVRDQVDSIGALPAPPDDVVPIHHVEHDHAIGGARGGGDLAQTNRGIPEPARPGLLQETRTRIGQHPVVVQVLETVRSCNDRHVLETLDPAEATEPESLGARNVDNVVVARFNRTRAGAEREHG